MAWSAPVIHAVGDVLTAADWNVNSNDITLLGGSAFATVATSQGTSSLSSGDLATPGPAVTVTTGANAIVFLSAQLSSNTTNDGALMGFAVSGATTIAASTGSALYHQSASGGADAVQASACYPVTGLTAGSNTFTAKYQAIVGGTASFGNRVITVIPLP